MASQHEYAKQLGKAPFRMIENQSPVLLSEKLAWLAAQKQQASTWWAAEVKKLVEPARWLEGQPMKLAWRGMAAGMCIGLAIAWYLLKFG